MLDGLKNRVVEVDVVPDEGDVGSESNYYGNGFSTVKRVFTTAKTSVSDYDASKTRTWVMENPNKKHRSTGGNIGYKLGELDTGVLCTPLAPLTPSSLQGHAASACEGGIACLEQGSIRASQREWQVCAK